MANNRKLGSELQGIARLIQDATIGIADIAENLHRQILHPPLLPTTPIQTLLQNLAGVTYQGVRVGAKLIGGGLDGILEKLTPVLGEIKSSEDREAIRAALNGVLGDYLEGKNNPLATQMHFRTAGRAVEPDSVALREALPAVNGKILLLVHGSCMSDLQWTRNAHNHGLALATDFGYTPIFLRYNSGRHISANGRDLSALLEDLISQWPVPVEELVLLSHSMGGLVSRSAVHYGSDHAWPQHLRKMVFLGTPHHGAQLERIGSYLDAVLASVPYARPFARLGKIRSHGVTDLRYGNVVDEDWQGRDRFKVAGDPRTYVPLPDGVGCYSIAAVTGTGSGTLSTAVGDRLVDVKSALGQHRDPYKDLQFPPEHTWIAQDHSHLDLLDSADVYGKLKLWLG